MRIPHVLHHPWRLLILCALVLLGVLAGRVRAADAPALPGHAALDLAVLKEAYPGAVLGLERGASGHLELVLAGGGRLVYDDGRARTPREAEEDPDVRTMLAQAYPLGPVDAASAAPAPGFDPGRHRVQAFFTALYGASEAEVRKGCASVRFDGHGVAFSARHGAAQALARVAARLAELAQGLSERAERAEWATVLRPLGGTLAWRPIAGTKRLSMHSFGVAIDLNPHLPYWRTERHPETVAARRQAFPAEILAAFEAEGFIWGGKWAAFDLMHFEYRPELVLKARALRGEIALKP